MLDFKGKCRKTWKNAPILLPLNWNFSGLGWCILDSSKPVSQGDFGAHSDVKLVSQFMQTKCLRQKMVQNSTIISKSIVRDCIQLWFPEGGNNDQTTFLSKGPISFNGI